MNGKNKKKNARKLRKMKNEDSRGPNPEKVKTQTVEGPEGGKGWRRVGPKPRKRGGLEGWEAQRVGAWRENLYHLSVFFFRGIVAVVQGHGPPKVRVSASLGSFCASPSAGEGKTRAIFWAVRRWSGLGEEHPK